MLDKVENLDILKNKEFENWDKSDKSENWDKIEDWTKLKIGQN